MALTDGESLYCLDLKIRVERKIVKKLFLGNGLPLLMRVTFSLGGRLQKLGLCWDLMLLHGQILCLTWMTNLQHWKEPCQEEKILTMIFPLHKNSIDVDDGSNDNFEKTLATKFELPYTEGGK